MRMLINKRNHYSPYILLADILFIVLSNYNNYSTRLVMISPPGTFIENNPIGLSVSDHTCEVKIEKKNIALINKSH